MNWHYVLAVLVGLSCVGLSCVGLADDLPLGVSNSQDPADVSLSPKESLQRITVPDGFHVTLFAGEPDIRRPIAFDIDDRGRLWVVENYSHPNWREGQGSDRIVILEDSDLDGEFDQRKVFYDRGRYFSAIAVGYGGVWVGDVPNLVFIPDRDRDDVPDGPPEVKLEGFQRASPHNVINNFHWGPDGWLYGAQGEPTRGQIGVPGTPKEERETLTRGIWRYNPVDDRFEVLARGMVNPWGADFNEYGDLFTVNTVIAHLWHIVPGMYCQRRAHERDNPFAYDRIQSIADHLHWSGGRWTDSRSTTEQHHVAGGGHAHCGAMIYLGDNWPEEYRGELFTGNLHGNRLNNEKLMPDGASYIGVHQPDFLFANDRWFRSMTQKYGPDGGVYISDWHDFGECHDKDGSHRTSGRIYKVVYGKPAPRRVDLQSMSDLELAKLHTEKNEWLVRHARRILHERYHRAADNNTASGTRKLAIEQLRQQFDAGEGDVQRLRALWTLALIEGVSKVDLVRLSGSDKSPHVRKWATKLLVDLASSRGSEWDVEICHVVESAARDSSPIVRLVAACALQKMPEGKRWPVVERLVSHVEDKSDHYLPLMVWYGIESEVNRDVDRALKLAAASSLPQVTQYIARKVAQLQLRDTDQLLTFAGEIGEAETLAAFLAGVAAAFEDRGSADPPSSWPDLQRRLADAEEEELQAVGNRLALAFGDVSAIKALQTKLVDPAVGVAERRAAFRVLRRLPQGLPGALLRNIIESEDESGTGWALEELSVRGGSAIGGWIVDRFAGFSKDNQRRAVTTLASWAGSAQLLLAEVARGAIDRKLVSAYDLQKLRLHRDKDIQSKLSEIWPASDEVTQKVDTIQRYKRLLSKEFLSTGNPSQGRRLFEETCAKCHRLFGEGSELAPDLTGSGRADLDYVLSNLVDPSAIVDPVYRLTSVITEDGRVLTGFLAEQTERSVVLRTQQGEIEVPLGDVEAMETSSKSMMPERQLERYSDEEIRDLVLYLASPEQVSLPQD